MMIGPAPIRRMLSMSVRLGTGREQLLQSLQHQMVEAIKERAHIVRAGTRLRMTLKAKRRVLFEGKSLKRAIKERAMGCAHGVRQRRLVNGEAVILAGDEHPAAVEVLHRMIRAVMAELHLDRARAAGKAEELMPQANSKHRDIRIENITHRADCIVQGLRIPRAIRKKHAIGC